MPLRPPRRVSRLKLALLALAVLVAVWLAGPAPVRTPPRPALPQVPPAPAAAPTPPVVPPPAVVPDTVEAVPAPLPVPREPRELAPPPVTADSAVALPAPEPALPAPGEEAAPPAQAEGNAGAQRVLLMGDSQAGGLFRVVNDYCVENGHQLVATFTWFSATTYNFAYSRKVEELLAEHRPTLVILVLGLNELYAADTAKRAVAARALHAKLADVPYLWVGPANFTEDRGINEVYARTALPGRFMLSKHLEIPRGSDRRHPSTAGYRLWMQSIAGFMRESPLQYPFPFEEPATSGHRFTGRLIMANAAKDRGY